MRHIAFADARELQAQATCLDAVSAESVDSFMDRVFHAPEDDGVPACVVLPAPVVHPLAMGSDDAALSLLLDLPDEELWRVLLHQQFVVVRAEPELPVLVGQFLSERELAGWWDELGPRFDAVMGGEALAELLAVLDLTAELRHARSAAEREPGGRAARRVAFLQRWVARGLSPQALALRVLPIAPRALRRPGTPAHDLDELYVGVLRHSTRLSLMQRVSAPEMVQRGARELLVRAVEALFANGRGGRVFTRRRASAARPAAEAGLFSLSNLLRAHELDVTGVFEGRAVEAAAEDEVRAVLRAVGLRLA